MSVTTLIPPVGGGDPGGGTISSSYLVNPSDISDNRLFLGVVLFDSRSQPPSSDADLEDPDVVLLTSSLPFSWCEGDGVRGVGFRMPIADAFFVK